MFPPDCFQDFSRKPTISHWEKSHLRIPLTWLVEESSGASNVKPTCLPHSVIGFLCTLSSVAVRASFGRPDMHAESRPESVG